MARTGCDPPSAAPVSRRVLMRCASTSIRPFGCKSVHAGRAVLLTLPDASRWIFDTLDAPISIEESIFFAAADGPHACEQIVIYGDTAQKAQIAWSFRQFDEEDSAVAAKSETTATPQGSEPASLPSK